MKIVLACSMSAAEKCIEVKKILEGRNHIVEVPRNIEKYAGKELAYENRNESTENKVKFDLIKRYHNIIERGDILVVVNQDKGQVVNYIGGNTFIEMAFAHVLDKKIFLLNPVPDMIYTDEIIAMNPIILNGDLSKVK